MSEFEKFYNSSYYKKFLELTIFEDATSKVRFNHKTLAIKLPDHRIFTIHANGYIRKSYDSRLVYIAKTDSITTYIDYRQALEFVLIDFYNQKKFDIPKELAPKTKHWHKKGNRLLVKTTKSKKILESFLHDEDPITKANVLKNLNLPESHFRLYLKEYCIKKELGKLDRDDRVTLNSIVKEYPLIKGIFKLLEMKEILKRIKKFKR